jgi:hypothetical protein
MGAFSRRSANFDGQNAHWLFLPLRALNARLCQPCSRPALDRWGVPAGAITAPCPGLEARGRGDTRQLDICHTGPGGSRERRTHTSDSVSPNRALVDCARSGPRRACASGRRRLRPRARSALRRHGDERPRAHARSHLFGGWALRSSIREPHARSQRPLGQRHRDRHRAGRRTSLSTTSPWMTMTTAPVSMSPTTKMLR